MAQYLRPSDESRIVQALQSYANSPIPSPSDREWARDYADALQNDTYLVETFDEPGYESSSLVVLPIPKGWSITDISLQEDNSFRVTLTEVAGDCRDVSAHGPTLTTAFDHAASGAVSLATYEQTSDQELGQMLLDIDPTRDPDKFRVLRAEAARRLRGRIGG